MPPNAVFTCSMSGGSLRLRPASMCGAAAYPHLVMSETTRRPRRDADGRLATAGDLLGMTAAGLVVGLGVLLAFETIAALLELAQFGDASGWLVVVLPAWLFVEEFRAAPFGAARIVAALAATGVGLAAGLTAAGLVAAFPPLVSGAVGAATLSVCYAVTWFYGLRWLIHRMG
jgi:hypothetical protein